MNAIATERLWGIVDTVNSDVLDRKLTTAEAAHMLLTHDGCRYEIRNDDVAEVRLYWGRHSLEKTTFVGGSEAEIFEQVVFSDDLWHGNEAVDEARMSDWWEFSPLSNGVLYGYDERGHGFDPLKYADVLNADARTKDTVRHIHTRRLSELDALELELDQRADENVVNINDELAAMGLAA